MKLEARCRWANGGILGILPLHSLAFSKKRRMVDRNESCTGILTRTLRLQPKGPVTMRQRSVVMPGYFLLSPAFQYDDQNFYNSLFSDQDGVS